MDTEEIARLREIARLDRVDAERQAASRTAGARSSTRRLEAVGLAALGVYGLLTLVWCAWPSPAIRTAALTAAVFGAALLLTRQAVRIRRLVRDFYHHAGAPADERTP